jgi:hypothetical protein
MLSYPVELLEKKTRGYLMVITTNKGKTYEIELEDDGCKIYNIVKDMLVVFQTGIFLTEKISPEDLKEISIELI